MNQDLISREALKEVLKECAYSYDGVNTWIMKDEVLGIIDNAPAVEITDYDTGYQDGLEDGLNDIRPQGKWKYHKAEGYFLPTMECSECHANDLLGGLTKKEYKAVNNFCWNCGADMRKGDVE